MLASKEMYYLLTLFLILLLTTLCTGCGSIASKEARVVRTYECHIDERGSFKDTKEIVIIKDSEGNILDRYEKKAVVVTRYEYNKLNFRDVSKAQHDTYVDIGNGKGVLTRRQTGFDQFDRPYRYQSLYSPENDFLLGTYSLNFNTKFSNVYGSDSLYSDVFYSEEQEKDGYILKRSFYNYYKHEILDALEMYSGDLNLSSTTLHRNVGDAGELGDIFDMGDEYLLFRKEVLFSNLGQPDMEYFLPPEEDPFFETHTLVKIYHPNTVHKEVAWSINNFYSNLPSEVYRYDGDNLILMDIPPTDKYGKELGNVRDVNIIFNDAFTDRSGNIPAPSPESDSPW